MCGVAGARRQATDSEPERACDGRDFRARGTPGSRCVVIGASTGGPAALARALGPAPSHSPAAITIVQHVDEHFAPGLASWLAGEAKRAVRVISRGDRPEMSAVQIAASDQRAPRAHRTLNVSARVIRAEYPHRPLLTCSSRRSSNTGVNGRRRAPHRHGRRRCRGTARHAERRLAHDRPGWGDGRRVWDAEGFGEARRRHRNPAARPDRLGAVPRSDRASVCPSKESYMTDRVETSPPQPTSRPPGRGSGFSWWTTRP